MCVKSSSLGEDAGVLGNGEVLSCLLSQSVG